MSRIEAVGFDLDHTLVVYDDQPVNALADAEARAFLVDDLGYAPSLVESPFAHASMSRGLEIDTTTGHVLKRNAAGQVIRARHGHRWEAADYRHVAARDTHPLYTPFDIPTGVIFGDIVAGDANRGDYATVLSDVRTMLDRSHTRGEFKRRLVENLDGYAHVDAAGVGIIERLKSEGRKVFLVTNSSREYTEAVLDRFVPSWSALFDIVAADADKPAFFGNESNGGATSIERQLGVSGGGILYVGDSVKADALPAARFGWKTLLIAPELSSEHGDWGPALREGDQPTWFARSIRESADGAAASTASLGALCGGGLIAAEAHPSAL